MLCDRLWNYLKRPRPKGLGLNVQFRTLEAMLLSKADMELPERILVAIAVYAIMRSVHTARVSNDKLKPAPLLRLYITQGLQGSKAKRILSAEQSAHTVSHIWGL